jgi:TRAP-type transport system periplasmic protein
LSGKGLIFNTVDQAQFRDALTTAGFFRTWQKNFGPEIWSTLEKYSGPLG